MKRKNSEAVKRRIENDYVRKNKDKKHMARGNLELYEDGGSELK